MYDPSGHAAGSSFRVNTYTTDTQWASSAAAVGDGSFIVAWTSFGDQDRDGTGIFARAIDASGSPAGAEFQINSYSTGFQYNSAISRLGDDRFVVAWTGVARGGDGVDAIARVFGADAQPQGDDFLVSEPHPVTEPATTTTVSAGARMFAPAQHAPSRRTRGARHVDVDDVLDLDDAAAVSARRAALVRRASRIRPLRRDVDRRLLQVVLVGEFVVGD